MTLIIQLPNILFNIQIMIVNNSKNFINFVSIIDELIMELSYIKNGNLPSVINIKKGKDLIDQFINLIDNSNSITIDDNLMFTNFKNVYNGYNLNQFPETDIQELKGASTLIDRFLTYSNNFDSNEIEKTQELLLRISLPIWKVQVLTTKSNQFKLMDL